MQLGFWMLTLEEYILQLPEGASKPSGVISGTQVFSIEDPMVVEEMQRLYDLAPRGPVWTITAATLMDET